MTTVLIIVAWLGLAYAYAGFHLGYFQNEYSSIAYETYHSDLKLAWVAGIACPPIAFFSFWIVGNFKYGWMNPLVFKNPNIRYTGNYEDIVYFEENH